jgi:hypothetical protein
LAGNSSSISKTKIGTTHVFCIKGKEELLFPEAKARAAEEKLAREQEAIRDRAIGLAESMVVGESISRQDLFLRVAGHKRVKLAVAKYLVDRGVFEEFSITGTAGLPDKIFTKRLNI